LDSEGDAAVGFAGDMSRNLLVYQEVELKSLGGTGCYPSPRGLISRPRFRA
jgi:hypothetical protein